VSQQTLTTRESAAAPHVLVAGGDADPNLGALLGALERRGVVHESLLVGAHAHPRVTWDLDEDELLVNGAGLRPRAIFIRNDVFTGLASRRPEPFQRALAWYTTIHGWAVAHPEVRINNRASALNVTNKPHALCLAREVGLDIPSTVVSNDFELLSHELEARPRVAKPVNGGDYTRELSEVLRAAPVLDSSLPAPAIVQERLVPPEIRVYRVGERFFAYQLVADALDYRTTAECKVVPFEVDDLPEGLTDKLRALTDRLQIDFGAADFKACPRTGRLLFLEINNGPMFAAFDAVSDNRLTDALVDFLCL
jgi:glutathione synthase/RimK-type ligase-like ATP-grasp enzyme